MNPSIISWQTKNPGGKANMHVPAIKAEGSLACSLTLSSVYVHCFSFSVMKKTWWVIVGVLPLAISNTIALLWLTHKL